MVARTFSWGQKKPTRSDSQSLLPCASQPTFNAAQSKTGWGGRLISLPGFAAASFFQPLTVLRLHKCFDLGGFIGTPGSKAAPLIPQLPRFEVGLFAAPATFRSCWSPVGTLWLHCSQFTREGDALLPTSRCIHLQRKPRRSIDADSRMGTRGGGLSFALQGEVSSWSCRRVRGILAD